MGNSLKNNDFIGTLLFTIPLKIIILYLFFSSPNWKWDVLTIDFLIISGYIIFKSLNLTKKQKIFIIFYACILIVLMIVVILIKLKNQGIV